MYEDYYGFPYDDLGLLQYLLSDGSGLLYQDPVSLPETVFIGDQPAVEPLLPQPIYTAPAPEPIYTAPAPQPILSEPVSLPAFEPLLPEPIYNPPAPEPVYVAPTPIPEPVYTLPTPQPILMEPVSLPAVESLLPAPEPVYTPPTPQPILAEPVAPAPEPVAPAPEPVAPAPIPEPVYTLPTPQPILAEPVAPMPEPVYTLPTPQPVLPEPIATPVMTQPTRDGLLDFGPVSLPEIVSIGAELPAEPVYTLPTPQPVLPEPLPAEQVLPTPQPVVPEPVPVQQTLPTEQPVVAEPAPTEPAPIDLGGWNLANFQNQFMQDGGASALADYIGQQAAQGNLYTSPIGDALTNSVLMPGAMSGLLNLYGETPQEQALRYFNLDARDTRIPITFDPRTYTGGYQLVDNSGNVMATANTEAELESLINRAAGMQGAKDQYTIQGINAEGKPMEIYTQPDKSTLGDLLLAMAGVAGAGFGLSALGLGAAGAGGAAAGGLPSVSSVLGSVGSQLAGTSFLTVPTAATTAGLGAGLGAGASLGAASSAVAPIVVKGIPLAAGTGLGTLGTGVLGAGTLAGGIAAANSAGLGTTNYGDQLWNEPATAPGGEIVVNAPTISPPPPTPPLSLGDILTLPATAAPLTAIPNMNVPMQEMPPEVPAEPEIVVEGAPRPPLPPEAILTLPPVVPPLTAVTPPNIPLTEPPPPAENNLLRDLLRYYTLGSGLLDALGVGRGGSTAPTTPYTSTLGALPNFSRGPFTPFQGDYEQYGFGPEWNFFGGR